MGSLKAASLSRVPVANGRRPAWTQSRRGAFPSASFPCACSPPEAVPSTFFIPRRRALFLLADDGGDPLKVEAERRAEKAHLAAFMRALAMEVHAQKKQSSSVFFAFL